MTLAAPPEAAGAAALRSPYIGLTPYSEADAAYFFGRERDTRLIVANLRGSPLTLLYGASGVGKSSVLQAGVVPALRARGQRVQGRDRRAAFSVAVVREWRGDPLVTLAEAVRSSVAEVAPGVSLPRWEPGTPLVDTLRSWTAHVRTGLVILDQFEEYFLYHPDDGGPGTFARELAQVVGDHELRVHILMSLREDALSLLDRFKAAIPGLFSNYLRIDYLDRAAARRAIEGPVQEYNRRLPEGEPGVVVDPPLVDAVLDQVRTGNLALGDGSTPAVAVAESGSGDRVETPFLQLVMRQLWSATAGSGNPHISLQALNELGGAERIVSTHLQDALAALSPERQRIAAELFAFLVTPSKTKIAQAPSDLAFWTRHPQDEVEAVVRELCTGERRILRAVPPPLGETAGVERYEIFHDVLAAPVTEWRQAQEQLREKDALAARLDEEQRERKVADRRRRRAVAAAVGALVLAAAVIVVAIVALHERSTARAQRATARAAALAGAANGQLDNDPELSLALAMKASDTKVTPLTVQALRAALAGSRVRATLRSGRSAPCPACRTSGPALAPGSEPPSPMAIGRTGLVAGWTAEGIVIWNPVTGHARRIPAPTSTDRSLSFSPDGRNVLTFGYSGQGAIGHLTVREIPVDGGAPRTLKPSSALTGVAFSPDGREIVGGGRGALERWDTATLKRKPALRATPRGGVSDKGVTFGGPGGRVLASGAIEHRGVDLWSWPPHGARHIADGAYSPAHVSPDGRFIAAYTYGGHIAVWNRASGRRMLLTGDGDLRGFSADSRRLLVIPLDDDTDAKLLGIRPPHAVSTLSGHLDTILAAAFSPAGGLLATASADSTVRLWDVATARPAGVLRGHSGEVTDLAFSADGRFLATFGSDQTLRLWETRAGRTLRDATKTVLDARFSSDGTRIVTGGEDGTVRIYDRRGRLQQRVVLGRVEEIGSLAFSQNGRRIVTATKRRDFRSGLLDVRDATTGRRIAWRRTLPLAAAAPMPDDRRIITADFGGRVIVWQLERQQLRRVKVIHLSQRKDADEGTVANSLRVSRDGGWIALGATDGTVRLYSGRDYHRIFVRQAGLGAGATVYAASFNPAATRLVTAGTGQPGRIWSVPGGHQLRTIAAGTGAVFGAEFSPDGRQIVTGGVDGTTRIWDVASGRPVVTLREHANAVDSVAFSPDGHSILSAGDDRTARLYRCEVCGSVDALRALAKTRLTRELTQDEVRRYAEGG